MRGKRIFQLGLLFALALSGFWLLTRQSGIGLETAERQSAMRALAPAGSITNTTGGETLDGVLDAVTPVRVNLADVVIDYEHPDSMYERWINGELDLENEYLVSDGEWAQMQAEALAQDPTPNLQDITDLERAEPWLQGGGGGWESIDYTEGGGSVPPDPEMAVGPVHIIATVNVAIAMYDKTGTVVWGPAPANNLFGGVPNCQSGLYDPNVVYDEEARRWIVLYDKGAFSASGGFCVAASENYDPTGDWNAYFFPVNSGSAWADYPHTGVGDNYIFTGANLFDYNGFFVEGRIWAFNKADLYAGNPVSAITRSIGNLDTPQPLNLHGAADDTWPNFGDTHYFLAEVYDGRNYPLLEWNPASGAFVNRGNIDLGAANQPISSPQNGAGLLQGNDWRPQDFEYRNGYGWTTNTISCNPGSGTVNCVRWAQVDIANVGLGPAGSGIIGSNGQYRYFGDTAANRCNDAVFGYTRSSSATFPSVYISTRTAASPPGQILGESLVKAGEIAYTAFDGSPHRWGDYTGLTIDPNGWDFWYLGQYSENTGTTNGRWGTYIYSTTNPGCSFNPIMSVYMPIVQSNN